MLGVLSVTHSLAQVLVGTDVHTAYSLSLGDGRIAARLAGSLITQDVSLPTLERADVLAQGALRHDPTAVIAAAMRGLAADGRDRPGQATAWFGYAARLSRRELRTQLWAIQSSVARNDIAGALHHYDIAMRGIESSKELLFPILAGATTEPEIGRALVRTLSLQPEWGPSFLSYLALNSPDLKTTEQLLVELQQAHAAVPDSARAATINALVAKQNYDDAWRLYRVGTPGADRSISRDPMFRAATDAPSVFDWVTVTDDAGSAIVQPLSQGGVFTFSMPAGTGGPLLRQLQLLPPGRYVLTGRSAGIDVADDARPYWTLSCVNSNRQVAQIAMPGDGRRDGQFAGMIFVPDGCDAQMLELTARITQQSAGVSGDVSFVIVRPVR